MIDQGTVEQIMETANSQIVEVVSEFVQLKRRGVNYLGRCPFHDEKTPSFTVSPHKGIFKCFGCGKGGNAVHFLMEHEQQSFIEAIKYLGAKFHIHIEEEEVTPEMLKQRSERESMMVVTEFAASFFSDMLNNSDEGKSVGLGYLRQRGFRDDIIARFQLGYSPEKRDALIVAAKAKGYKPEYLEKTGLMYVGDNYKADRFRGRVMFPIHSLSGKVIGFGGRILKTDTKKVAKYQNSPESEIYHKSRVLYGIFQAKQEISKQDRCYLVEGYTDVMSFHQTGITNVVASSGTALTQDQIKLISRFTKNVTVIYDGDSAGIKASLRGIDLILAEGLNVKTLLLPDGEDPDSFSKKMTSDQLKEYITANESDFVRFKTKLLLEDAKGDPIKKATLIQDIVRTIAIIPDAITRSVYVKECSILLEIEEPVLFGEITKIKQKKSYADQAQADRERAAAKNRPATPSATKQKSTGLSALENNEREVLRFLIKYGDVILFSETNEDNKEVITTVGDYIIYELQNDEIVSENPLFNKILNLYKNATINESFTAQKFFTNNQDIEIAQLASDFILDKHKLSKMHEKFGSVTDESTLLIDHVPKVVTELKLENTKVKIAKLQLKLKDPELAKNPAEVSNIMIELNKQNKIKAAISQALGGRTIV